LGKSVLALAALAGRTVVDAAAADEWKTAQRRFARLLGRGDANQTWLAEQRLEETREKLISAARADIGLIRMALEAGWAGRLLDFMEENPDGPGAWARAPRRPGRAERTRILDRAGRGRRRRARPVRRAAARSRARPRP
jgi:hypothetical protein